VRYLRPSGRPAAFALVAHSWSGTQICVQVFFFIVLGLQEPAHFDNPAGEERKRVGDVVSAPVTVRRPHRVHVACYVFLLTARGAGFRTRRRSLGRVPSSFSHLYTSRLDRPLTQWGSGSATTRLYEQFEQLKPFWRALDRPLYFFHSSFPIFCFPLFCLGGQNVAAILRSATEEAESIQQFCVIELPLLSFPPSLALRPYSPPCMTGFVCAGALEFLFDDRGGGRCVLSGRSRQCFLTFSRSRPLCFSYKPNPFSFYTVRPPERQDGPLGEANYAGCSQLF